MIHRDIKPGNLLLDERGQVSIADFGIARFTQDAASALAPTADGQVMGTVAYLPPERALGRAATTASDVYALGCVLYQLLTGTVPFYADLAAAILYQHVHTEPVPPHQLRPSIPSALAQYVLRLLAKDPGERPTAEQAGNWLRQWTPGPAPIPRTTAPGAAAAALPSSAPLPASGGQPRADRSRPKMRRVLVTGSAVVALGAATAGILALSGQPSNNGLRPAQSRPAPTSPHPASVPAHPGPTPPPPSSVTSQPSHTPPAISTATTSAPSHSSRPAHGNHDNANGHDKKPKKPMP